jgi:hypothetical protein
LLALITDALLHCVHLFLRHRWCEGVRLPLCSEQHGWVEYKAITQVLVVAAQHLFYIFPALLALTHFGLLLLLLRLRLLNNLWLNKI